MRILVLGTFDNIHLGHKFLLKEAASRGELWVVVALDENVELFKGRKPLQSASERKSAIEKFLPEAHVILGNASDYLAPVKQVQPDLIVLGYDQLLLPGIDEKDLSCSIERLSAFEPSKYKSSVQREGGSLEE